MYLARKWQVSILKSSVLFDQGWFEPMRSKPLSPKRGDGLPTIGMYNFKSERQQCNMDWPVGSHWLQRCRLLLAAAHWWLHCWTRQWNRWRMSAWTSPSHHPQNPAGAAGCSQGSANKPHAMYNQGPHINCKIISPHDISMTQMKLSKTISNWLVTWFLCKKIKL